MDDRWAHFQFVAIMLYIFTVPRFITSLPPQCPICGSTGFMRVWVTLPSGAKRETDLWTCLGCSVVCTDPKRFRRPAEVQKHPATPNIRHLIPRGPTGDKH